MDGSGDQEESTQPAGGGGTPPLLINASAEKMFPSTPFLYGLKVQTSLPGAMNGNGKPLGYSGGVARAIHPPRVGNGPVQDPQSASALAEVQESLLVPGAVSVLGLKEALPDGSPISP